jgi:hypothetical protein
MSTQVSPFTVVFPEWYDERCELEVPAKGWLQGVEVRLEDGSRYKLFFIDPVRLGQDLEEEVRLQRPYFAEPGLVVLPEVTTEAVRQAVAGLWRDGFFEHLRPLPQE